MWHVGTNRLVRARLLIFVIATGAIAGGPPRPTGAADARPAASAGSTPNSASPSGAPQPGVMVGKNEMVLAPGMQVTATTSVGTITITAGQGFKRYYTWEGATGSVTLIPRSQAWHGSLGAYNPGFLNFWRLHNGLDRVVADEGQQHFATVADFTNWLRIESASGFMPFVYRDDGLAVGWLKVPSRYALDVEVWQIYIGSGKPTKLPGSQNDKISVRMVSKPPRDTLTKHFFLF
jgi:hypothetical protein